MISGNKDKRIKINTNPLKANSLHRKQNKKFQRKQELRGQMCHG